MLTEVLGRTSGAFVTLKKRFSAKALVLAYHRILDAENDPWSMCVSEANFEQHLAVLRRRFKPTSLHELSQSHRSGNVPHGAVVLTFDDGYADNLTVGAPILESFDIPATVFITTGQVGAENEFWWDELERALLGPERLPERLSLMCNGERCTWRLDKACEYPPEQRQRDRSHKAWEAKPGTRLHFYYTVWDHLRRMSPPVRRGLQDEILTWAKADPNPRPDHRAFSVEQLKSLGRHPLIEIGAHTVSHPFLPQCSAKEQRAEISDSKQYLEELLAAPIRSFAYPHGEYTEETVRIVSNAGFDTACALTDQAVWRMSDRLRFPRYSIENWDGAQFENRIQNWLKS